jgi:hypothetical protein
MSRSALPTLLALLSLSTLPACNSPLSLSHSDGVQGDGVSKSESRDVSAFDSIELDGMLKLELTSGPLGKLSLSGDENILPLIATSVTAGKLVIRQSSPGNSKTPILITLRAPNVSRIAVNGAAKVDVKGLDVPSFALAASGAADAELTGQVGKLDIDLSGAGRVRAAGLLAKEAHVGLSGAGSVEVNASDKLKAEVSGVGSVRYRGNPPTFEKNVSGLGSVAPLG